MKMADENLKTFGIVFRALKNLTEAQGPTPQQILSYINTEYNIPKETIKRQLGPILKRCKELGILKKTYGHQRAIPKITPNIAGKAPCCDCKDCRGKCGYCTPDEKQCEKKKQRICRSSKPKCKMKKKRDSCKKKVKRSGCKKKKKKKKKCRKAKKKKPKCGC